MDVQFKDSCFSCPIFSKCSGCKTQKDVRTPEVWKEIFTFFSEDFSVFPELISKEIVGWRFKAKLAVRGLSSRPQIGLFEMGSHHVVDMQTCPMHVPVMNEALKTIRSEMQKYGVVPYREDKHRGRLRYLQMHANRTEDKVQLALVFNGSELEKREKEFVKQLYTSGLFHSIWSNHLTDKTNSIFGSSWSLLFGEEDFFQKILGVSFAFHPGSFSQAHLSLFEEMIVYISSLIASNRRILELYAGVGCIGVHLAENAKKVTLVETSPFAEKSFEKTMQKLPKSFKEKCFFLSAKVEDIDLDLEEVDTILVDPPRKGLSQKCKEHVFKSKATQLIYISCGYESFMRDCQEITEKGWGLESARGFLLFPATNHVEIVASFQKT